MARRTLLITYIATYVVAITSMIRTIIWFFSDDRILLICLLLGIYLILLLMEPSFIRRRRNFIYIYLILQTIIICALASIISEVDFWAVWFAPLSVQVMYYFSSRTGYFIVGLFTVLMAIFILSGLGNQIGLPLVFVYTSIYFLLATFINIIQVALQARLESEEKQAELELAHQQLQAYTEQAEKHAVQQERSRLSRELHDSVTQSLHSATLMAEAGQRLVDSGDIERAKGYLSRLGEISQQALREMRLLVYELRPFALRGVGLAGALQQRLDTVERRSGVEVDLNLDKDLKIPPELEEELFWIAIEALNNALKHANPSRVEVSSCQEDHDGKPCYGLIISDNGGGFDPGSIDEVGIGLVSMQERIEKLGGELDIQSAPGKGTKVKTCVHLEKSA
jgi:signal transduction histidine kinase